MASGEYRYRNLQASDVADKFKLSDFAESGTRELTADDYVYGIRRLATPRIKSPAFSTMADYIVGLAEYGQTIGAVDKELRKGLAPTDRNLPFLDFRKYDFPGAQAIDPQPAHTWVYAKDNAAQAMLLHTASTCTDMQTALAKANSPRMNTAMVYATNLTIGTPWSALPTYWPQLLGTVDAINKKRTLPGSN